jgi:uncharacterized protein YndB with AHSA1/START domain
MPTFSLSTRSSGPVEEVWKLVHDPARFPEWWAGIETVEVGQIAPGETAYTIYPDGYPDFPMGQHLQEAPGRVTVSCLVSDLMYVWQLSEAGSGTDIAVTVELPEREAHRVPVQRQLMVSSLDALARLAAA